MKEKLVELGCIIFELKIFMTGYEGIVAQRKQTVDVAKKKEKYFYFFKLFNLQQAYHFMAKINDSIGIIAHVYMIFYGKMNKYRQVNV